MRGVLRPVLAACLVFSAGFAAHSMWAAHSKMTADKGANSSTHPVFKRKETPSDRPKPLQLIQPKAQVKVPAKQNQPEVKPVRTAGVRKELSPRNTGCYAAKSREACCGAIDSRYHHSRILCASRTGFAFTSFLFAMGFCCVVANLLLFRLCAVCPS